MSLSSSKALLESKLQDIGKVDWDTIKFEYMSSGYWDVQGYGSDLQAVVDLTFSPIYQECISLIDDVRRFSCRSIVFAFYHEDKWIVHMGHRN